MSAATARAAALVDATRASRQDGSVVVVSGVVSDLLVDTTGQVRRVLPMLADHAARAGVTTWAFSLAHGLRSVTPPEGLGAGEVTGAPVPGGVDPGTPPTVALDMMFEALRGCTTPVQVVVDFAEGLVPDGVPGVEGDRARIVEQLAAAASDSRLGQGGHRVVLLARTAPLDTRLVAQPGMRSVRLGLPGEAERRALVHRLVERGEPLLVLAEDLSVERFSRICGGLTLDDISRLRHCAAGRPVQVPEVIDLKSAALRRMAGSTLTVHEDLLDLDADLAGLPQVRVLLEEEQAWGDGQLRLILAGPPGTGKTRSATAIAGALGVPAVSLAQIRAPFVGQAEDNMDTALTAIEAMAPVVLIVDECDEQGFGRRAERGATEGSEVTANLRAKLFTWLGDNGDRLGVSVVGLTNRPDRLDPAAVDRFTVLPVLHPDPQDTVAVMAIHARRVGVDLDERAALDVVGASPVSVSGRQAVRLLDRARTLAARGGRDRVTGPDVADAVADAVGASRWEDEHQTLLAVQATTWASHLPWRAAATRGGNDTPPAWVRPFISSDGSLELPALRRRIRMLEVEHA